MHYVRALRFEDRPDYAGIRLTFKKLMRKEGFEYDHVFDWIIIAPQPSNMINFTVESFDDIKSVNRKKPLAKEQTVTNENQPNIIINDGGNTKRSNDQSDVVEHKEETKETAEALIQDENELETKREENLNESSAQLIQPTANDKDGTNNKASLINRLGVLESTKPKKLFLQAGNGAIVEKTMAIEKNDKKNKKNSNKKEQKGGGQGDENCLIF